MMRDDLLPHGLGLHGSPVLDDDEVAALRAWLVALHRAALSIPRDEPSAALVELVMHTQKRVTMIDRKHAHTTLDRSFVGGVVGLVRQLTDSERVNLRRKITPSGRELAR